MRIWSKRHRHTLTGKLLLLFLVVGLLFAALVTGGIGKFFSRHFDVNIRPHLVQYSEYVQQDIGIPPDRERATELAKKLKVDIYFDEPNGRWSTNEKSLVLEQLEFKRNFYHNDIEYGIAVGDDLELFWARLGETTVYIGIPDLRPDRMGSGYLHLLLPLIVLIILYHLILRLIRPIRALSEGVKRFGKGELKHRIDLNRRDELGELAENFNDMADDIEQMLDAKRQLLLAISHELRSPLTRAKISLELLDDEPQTEGLKADLVEMEKLIEELLETERLSNRHQVLNKQVVNLSELVVHLNDQFFESLSVSLEIDNQDLPISVDVTRIKLLVKNLLENALRHTLPGEKKPSLLLEKANETVSIVVEDFGIGIEADHIPHLTEPFYRADASRRRETGGYGLGLYLCRVIVEAHGGTLKIHSVLGKGTRVVVELPL